MKQHLCKRALALLTTVFVLGAAGCSNKTPPSAGSTSLDSASQAESGANEAVTFTIAVGLNPLSKDEDFNNKEAFKLAEKDTNVHINWMPIAAADASDKVNIMITSDLPDAFIGLIDSDQIASNMDSFADLAKDGVLEANAPHVVADYKTGLSNGLDIVTWPDGSIRSLMTGRQTSYENDGEGIMFMNKTWLDNVGMSVPTTTEEFYNVLKAFKEKDANGNGNADDEIPFEPSQSDWCSKIMNFANPWGIAGTDSSDESAYKMVKDNKVVSTVDTEDFRKFLEYSNKLVSEGLMDQEMFSQTSEQYHSKINEGVVGCYYTWSPYADMSESEAANWVEVPIIEAKDGSGYMKTGSQDKFAANRSGFCITSACTNVPRLLQWWDYLSSSTDIKYTCRFGLKGEAWDEQEGTIIEKIPSNLTDDYTIENYKYTQGMVDMGPFITKYENAKVQKDISFTSWYRIDCVEQLHNYCVPVDQQLPLRYVDPDKVSERTFIETELFAYIGTFIANSVLNGVNDTTWNTHLEQLKAVQYYDWLQWYQDYLDSKF
ncbi:MAG: hypothetical protein ACOYJR_02115 [Acutalibacteraceae bacterium]|jgi:putative aldouronate transport system substrate-binding protein